MSLLAFSGNPQIISNGGAIFKNTFKPASSTHFARGQLLKITSNGEVTPVLAIASSPATLDTDDTGTANARLFVAMEPYGSLATSENAPINGTGYPNDGYITVQELTADSVIEAVCCDSAASDASAALANIDGTYALFQLANGTWAVDLGNTTKPVVRVLDVEPNYSPFRENVTSDYNKVRVKILDAILAN